MLTLCAVLEADIEHGIVQRSSHEELETEIVDALRVPVGLFLLRLVPIENQAIPEGQAGGRVGSILIAIKHTPSERGLDMADNLLLEFALIMKPAGLVTLPGLALGLGNGS
jgi:hypothetical protein